MRVSHIAWNLAGLSVPLLVAAITIPSLLETLGKEKFGLLALAWGLIGYAGALDLGLGRALTQIVASLRGEQRLDDIPDTLATASRITFVTGMIAGIFIALFAIMGGAGIIQTESTSDSEIKFAILLLAVALPAQAMSATYKGLNEAFMSFKGVSILRATLGVINFAGPYAVSFFTINLPWLVSTLVLSRLLSLIFYKYLASQCLRNEFETQKSARYSAIIAKKLFSFGGWVTVSSVIGPIMVQADRFFIAYTISAAAVSTYVLPYEIVVQILVIVGAISTVMFPGLSQLIQERPDAWQPYFRKWLFRVAALMACTCIALAFLLPMILSVWIGPSLDNISIQIGQILCLGVFANSIASMYYSLIHAHGRADLTAKIHFIELPIYIVSLYIFSDYYGLLGIAVAWTARVIFDALSMFLIGVRIEYKKYT